MIIGCSAAADDVVVSYGHTIWRGCFRGMRRCSRRKIRISICTPPACLFHCRHDVMFEWWWCRWMVDGEPNVVHTTKVQISRISRLIIRNCSSSPDCKRESVVVPPANSCPRVFSISHQSPPPSVFVSGNPTASQWSHSSSQQRHSARVTPDSRFDIEICAAWPYGCELADWGIESVCIA